MKKKIFLFAALFGMGLGFTSCSDMLDTDSDRQIFDPDLDEKTDSIYYTLGILRGVQQVADQYVLTNEMRGDLTATNVYTSTDLRELANFSATTANKYDSAYVYYNIINNCNYYIAHRDTSLVTGSRKVAIPEYVQAKSIRAWAYLQLAKTYGTVPFYLNELTNVSDAESVTDTRDLQSICETLIADLKPWAGTGVPTYGTIDAGQMNNGTSKSVYSKQMMFPVDLVLGDLYLESGRYTEAAQSYFRYLNDHELSQTAVTNSLNGTYPNRQEIPRNIQTISGDDWVSTCFNGNDNDEVITIIPMATNRLRGTVTELPELFGYDYYTTDVASSGYSSMYMIDNEISPSSSYVTLCANTPYYYAVEASNGAVSYASAPFGDLRRYAEYITGEKDDSTYNVMRKYNQGNISIYRTGLVYLRLAEAMNRMGYPDAAFAVLKDGISQELLEDTLYMRPEADTLLMTTIPFLSEENISNYATSTGIHSRGCGYTAGMNQNLYTYKDQVWQKVNQTRSSLGLATVEVTDSTGLPSMEEQIDAVEDLICDELAFETAFEGHRFGDLCRLARHKNESNPWGDNYGSQWMAAKLAYKNPVVDLTNPDNWYLPFK